MFSDVFFIFLVFFEVVHTKHIKVPYEKERKQIGQKRES